MIDVALFGGAFNPIGLHHERIAELIFSRLSMRTWFMPCFKHKFEKNNKLAPAFHRWAMVVLSCNNSKVGSFAFDWEMRKEHSGAMYDTIAALKKEYPRYRFHIVVGMDNANLIESKWYRGKELIAENPFIVIQRRHVVPLTSWGKPHHVLSSDRDGSSTEIRDAIFNDGESFLAQSLDFDVRQYQMAHDLYHL